MYDRGSGLFNPGRVLDHGHLVWVKKYVLGGAAHSGKAAVLHGMNLV